MQRFTKAFTFSFLEMYFLLISIILIHVHVQLVFVDCCEPIGDYGVWNPWENCNQTCGGGIERRWRSICCPTVNGNWSDCLAEYNKTEKFIFEYRPCSETCDNGGSFINGTGCVCSPGYEGRCCSTDIDECQSSPCNNGTCQNLLNRYTCTCNLGYTGYNCDQDIDECQSNPCQNGTCQNHVNSYTCACNLGYTGYNCDQDINECTSNPCLNGGTCQNHVNKFTCTCSEGYGGDDCSINIVDCAGGTCSFLHTCVDKVHGHECMCSTVHLGSVGICAYYILTGALCLSAIIVCLVAWLVRRSMRQKVCPVPEPEKGNIWNTPTSQSPPSHKRVLEFSEHDSLFKQTPAKPRMFMG